MKNTKKAMGLTLAGTMILASLAGCGSAASSSDSASESASSGSQQTLYMITGQTTEYISMLTKAAENYAADAGYDLKISDAAADWSKEITLIENAQNDNAEAIIIIPSASDDVDTILDAAGDTKVVFLNRELTDTSALDENHVYIGPDEQYSGAYQGEMLADCLKEAGKTDISALILTGPETLQHSIRRTEGVKTALADAGINASYIEVFGNEDTDEAAEAITAAYDGKEIDFDVIISENDAMACGAVKAFEEMGMSLEGIPVVGIDATSDAVQYIKDGVMYGTIYQDVTQAEQAVQACINLLQGKAYNDGLSGEASADNVNITLTGWVKVTQENVDTYNS